MIVVVTEGEITFEKEDEGEGEGGVPVDEHFKQLDELGEEDFTVLNPGEGEPRSERLEEE
jgi:hypothetical protein